MKIEKLVQLQQKLDSRIDYDKPDRAPFKFLALRTELGECANEWRYFKFWSTDRLPRSEKLLEEYVDALHFILSLGIEFGHKPKEIHSFIPPHEGSWTALEQFELVYSAIEDFRKHSEEYFLLEYLLEVYLGLGQLLGFSENNIFRAYVDKNEVNHTRQAEGY